MAEQWIEEYAQRQGLEIFTAEVNREVTEQLSLWDMVESEAICAEFAT